MMTIVATVITVTVIVTVTATAAASSKVVVGIDIIVEYSSHRRCTHRSNDHIEESDDISCDMCLCREFLGTGTWETQILDIIDGQFQYFVEERRFRTKELGKIIRTENNSRY